MQKKIGHDIPLMMGTTYQFLVAGIVMLAISIARGRTRFELTHTSFIVPSVFDPNVVSQVAAAVKKSV